MTDIPTIAELLPCPFCGAEPWKHVQKGDPLPGEYGANDGCWLTVWCSKCGIEGPAAFTEDEAITAWNRRSYLTRQSA